MPEDRLRCDNMTYLQTNCRTGITGINHGDLLWASISVSNCRVMLFFLIFRKLGMEGALKVTQLQFSVCRYLLRASSTSQPVLMARIELSVRLEFFYSMPQILSFLWRVLTEIPSVWAAWVRFPNDFLRADRIASFSRS